jgi:pteridine reductase
MDLRGKVALVTGGGIRVGRALVEALAEKGAVVAVHYNSSRSGADEVVAAIRSRGGKASAFAADLTRSEAPTALVDAVVSQLGRLDILINSAAVMVKTPFGTVDPDAWDSMFALNLRAPFFLAQAAAQHLRRARGAIINIADHMALESWPTYIPHSLTKGGVIHMTRALARELAPEVRVNAIAPGVVLMPESSDTRETERLVASTPLKRIGSPQDVAQAMLYLLEAEYVTGEMIIVDGGRHIRT